MRIETAFRPAARPAVDFNRRVHCLLGLPFDAVGMTGAVQRLRRAAARRRQCWISTPNVNFLIGSRTDAEFRDSVIHSDLSIADGMPLVWMAKLLGIPLPERVSGSSLFEQVGCGHPRGLSVYFFGGQPGVAQTACLRLNEQGGGIVCAGYESPGFGSVEELSSDASIARINASGADLLALSLGAKKGQAWIRQNRGRISVPVIAHLGATLNFAAGSIRRAPAWMQSAGLEWLWRVKEEAGIWRRYLADGLALLRLLATQVIPCAWLSLRRSPTRQDLDAATLELHDTGGELVIRLHGAWTQHNLGPARDAFADAARKGRHIRLDLSRAAYVDSAFLGLLLLLYGAQQGNDKRLACSPVHPIAKRIFAYSGAGFLLSAGDSAAAEAGAADEVALQHEE